MKGIKPAEAFNDHEEMGLYWSDGKLVYFRYYIIKNADLDSFVQFPGSWAKDKKHCYSMHTRLRNADILTFEILNYTYAKDKNNVWTLAGRIPEADAETFEVCDDGKESTGITFVMSEQNIEGTRESFLPFGYGKDRNNVYYYDFAPKIKIVKHAIPSSFKSLNDGYFGYDEKSVFCGKSILPKANPNTWKKLEENYFYSKDQNRIYYFNSLLKGADAASFEVVVVPSIFKTPNQYAKDKNYFYLGGTICSKEEFEKTIADDIAYNQEFEDKMKG
ncbi:DKNYY domain-containing protein [Flavobacterium ginsengiterrae]|uniref:DKNYY family protein n=1 Tax=Flavobacterium ginsengiterrae TaxID=871695 RepID=A0ABP7GPL0_9FLAO